MKSPTKRKAPERYTLAEIRKAYGINRSWSHGYYGRQFLQNLRAISRARRKKGRK